MELNQEHEATREQFEKWIRAEPYSQSTMRFGTTPKEYTWPGQYCRYETQLAWEAWCAALDSALE